MQFHRHPQRDPVGTQRQRTAVSTQCDPVGTQRQVLSAPASDNLKNELLSLVSTQRQTSKRQRLLSVTAKRD